MEQGSALGASVASVPLLTFLTVTLLAGSAGGCANYLLARNSKVVAEGGGADGLPWWGYCFVGVVAAFTVPLFLNLTQSNLLRDWFDHPNTSGGLVNLAVFGGFCLVAAFSSRAFMQGMADRVLAQLRREVEVAKKEMAEVKEEARREVEEAASSTAEAVSEVLEAPAATPDDSAQEPAAPPVSAFGRRVLNALLDGEQPAGVLAKKLSTHPVNVSVQFSRVLMPRQLVDRRRAGEDGPLLYSLTDRGRSFLQEADSNS